MKKKVCTMTMTGEHIWITDLWKILSGETSGSIRYEFPNPYKVKKCMACGMIDNRGN